MHINFFTIKGGTVVPSANPNSSCSKLNELSNNLEIALRELKQSNVETENINDKIYNILYEIDFEIIQNKALIKESFSLPTSQCPNDLSNSVSSIASKLIGVTKNLPEYFTGKCTGLSDFYNLIMCLDAILENNAGNSNDRAIKLAKIYAITSAYSAFNLVVKYKIKNQKDLREIALLCAKYHSKFTIQKIHLLGIQDVNLFFEVISECANQSQIDKYHCFSKVDYSSIDERFRFEIAKQYILENNDFRLDRIKDFDIKDPSDLLHLAELCAQKNGDVTFHFIEYFKIQKQLDRIKILKICAKQSGHIISCIDKWKIQDPTAIFEITMICAHKYDQILSRVSSIDLQDLGIHDQKTLVAFLKLCVQKNPAQTARHFSKYPIQDEKIRIEIAIIIAQQYPLEFIEKIDDFKIEDQKALIELAKICAQSAGFATATKLNKFAIQDFRDQIEIAKLCVLQDPSSYCLSKLSENGFEYEHTNFVLAFKGMIFKNPIEELIPRLKIWIETNFNNDQFLNLCDEIKNTKDTNIQQQKLNLFFESLFILDYCFSKEKINWVADKNLLPAIVNFVRPDLRQPLMDHLMNILNKNSLSDFEELLQKKANPTGKQTTAEKYEWVILTALILASLCAKGMSLKIAKKVMAKTSGRNESLFYKGDNHTLLIDMLVNLDKVQNLSINEKEDFLKQVFIDAKSSSIKKYESQQRKDAHLNSKEKEFVKDLNSLNQEILNFETKKEKLIILFKKYEFALEQLENITSIEKLEGKIKTILKKKNEKISKFAKNETLIEKLGIAAELSKKELLLAKSLNDLLLLNLDLETKKGCLDEILKNINLPKLTKKFNDKSIKTINDLNSKIEAFLKTFNTEENISNRKNKIKSQRKPYTSSVYESELIQKIQIMLSLSLLYLEKTIFIEKRPEDSLENILSRQIFKGLKLETVENFSKQYFKTFGSDRDRMAMAVYISKIASLQDYNAVTCLNDYVTSVLNGSFEAKRNSLDQNLHLQTIANKHKGLLEKWHQPLAPIKISTTNQTPSLTLLDSTDPLDLLLCGTEVADSCQSVRSAPFLNKGLLGYLMCGQNRLLVVKNEKNRIKARCLLKLLWDGEQAVVYLEKMYPRKIRIPESQQIALKTMAAQKAQALGLPLLSSDEGKSYGKSIFSLGGQAPWEYSDGGTTGGVRENGKFEVAKVYFVSE